MRVITTAAPPDCGGCRGTGLVRAGAGRGGWVSCEPCRGTGRVRPLAPYSVDWLRGDESGEGEMAVELIDQQIPDRELAVARALMHARRLGSDYAGGRVVVSDARGTRSFEVECSATLRPGKAVAP